MTTNRAQIPWYVKYQDDKRLLPVNKPDRVVVDKEHKRSFVMHVIIPNDSNIKTEKYDKN